MCDVVLPDPEVSREHVRVTPNGEGWRFADLTGRGLCADSQGCVEGQFADDCELTIGRWAMRFKFSRAGGDDQITLVKSTVTPTPSAPRHAAQLRIRGIDGDAVVRASGDSFTIGSSERNDVVVHSPDVAPRHLRVIRNHNRFRVIDVGTPQGVWIGDVRFAEAEVAFGTGLKLGATQLIFERAGTAVAEVRNFHGIIGDDPVLQSLNEVIARVAPSQATVAVFGESGTGKELVAQAIHKLSDCAHMPFIPVNCAAISRELIESELFGHERGAFTGAMVARKGAFEEADGGTLFLDEVGELPLELQPKLLRAIEQGEIKRVGAARPSQVRVRIVVATNRDLLHHVRSGEFREDLYFRLCVVPLHIPPLRSRPGDIPTLVHHFLTGFSPRGQVVHITQPAMQLLEKYHWPGNVREVRNVIHRALLLRRSASIDVEDLISALEPEAKPADEVAEPFAYVEGMKLDDLMLRAEQAIVRAALVKHNDNRERAARDLGISRSTMFKRLKQWGATSAGDQP